MGNTSYESGKCVWECLDDARSWAATNAKRAFYTPPVRVLLIELPAGARLHAGFYFMGKNLDGIGPAWMIPEQVLQCAKVSEVRTQ